MTATDMIKDLDQQNLTALVRILGGSGRVDDLEVLAMTAIRELAALRRFRALRNIENDLRARVREHVYE